MRRRRNRRRQRARILAIAVSCVGVLAAAFICFAAANAVLPWVVQKIQKQVETPQQEISRQEMPQVGLSEERIRQTAGDQSGAVDLTCLKSPYAVLVDAQTGEILAEHNGGTQIYPASLTKIMTAVLAVEYSGNLNETVYLPSDIYDQVYAEGASVAGFLPGETATLRDLLYGILLPSGAECCLTYARYVAGSEEAFVELMNEKAEQLGMKNTHFCNCTGLHDANHYSSAEDIAVLLHYALQNDTFREVFTSHYYYVQPTELHPDGFTFWSTMFANLDDSADGMILGGKTGYTGEAGLCLASLESVGGREYILVTAGAAGSHETAPYHIEDAVDVCRQLSE